MPPSPLDPRIPILPAELLDKIYSCAASSDDLSTLGSLALVSHNANKWTDQKLRRHVSVHFPELHRFLQVERPTLDSLEICPPKQFQELHSPESLGPLEADPLLIPRIWPNLTRLCVRDKYHLIQESCTFTEGLARLSNLTTLYLDYSRWHIIGHTQPPLVFPCLTHLYLPMPFLVNHEEQPTTVSPSCFPVLSHVAIKAEYDTRGGLFIYLDFHEAGRVSPEWLAIPSLRLLIFRWDKRDSEFDQDLQEYMDDSNLDDRVVYISLDDYDRGPSSEKDSCFESIDRVWKLGEEAFERRKTMRTPRDQ